MITMGTTSAIPLPGGWIETTLDDSQYFKLVGSGVEYWKGLKNYISTKSIQGTEIVEIEEQVRYSSRPSRANMQPKAGRVAFAKMKDTLKVLLIDKEIENNFILSTGFSLIEPRISSAYLFQFFQSWSFNHCKDLYSEGSTQQAISNDDYKNIIIRFPQILAEQQKIADVLSAVDEATKETARLIEKYKRIKHGLMQDLFRHGIDEHGQIRSETTHHFKDSPFGRIPEEWEVVELGTYFRERGGSIQTGPFGSQLHAVDYVEDGKPIITVEHLNDGKIAHEYVPRVNEHDYKRLIKYSLKEGDSVYSRVGAIDRCSYVSRQEDGWLFSGRCLRVRPGELFNPKFLSYLLNSHHSRTWILNNAVGSTMKCLNTAILSALPISIPTDTNEQSSIASVLTSIDEVLAKEEIYRQKLIDQKRGIMEDLLSGTVRVNHLIDKN